METRFQTSFIPRKPIANASPSLGPSAHHSFGGLFMTIATFLFIASLLSIGGAYLWRSYLYSSQATYQTELTAREKQFNITLIQQLEEESVKIDLAKEVLANHVAASQVFAVIGALTTEHVRFRSLDFTAPTGPGTDAKISLTGEGQSLSTVAFQSDVLGTLSQYGLANIVKNPILSNPSLDADGSVSFSLSAEIDPSVLSYEKEMTGSGSQSATASSSPSNQ